MRIQLKSYLFVIIQFSAIFYLLYNEDIFSNLLTSMVILPGIVLAFWSIWIMRKSVLSVFPDPDPQIKLITTGPYKFIRHPMYTSLFLVLIPVVALHYSNLKAAVLLIFVINQVSKLLFEEKLLLQKLPEYKSYMSNTWRLFPYIF